MRCELCNRAETEVFYDGEGEGHNYCYRCELEISETLEGYEDGDDDWVWIDTYDDGETEEYQDVTDSEVDYFPD